jgi:hypothetical protein
VNNEPPKAKSRTDHPIKIKIKINQSTNILNSCELLKQLRSIRYTYTYLYLVPRTRVSPSTDECGQRRRRRSDYSEFTDTSTSLWLGADKTEVQNQNDHLADDKHEKHARFLCHILASFNFAFGMRFFGKYVNARISLAKQCLRK